MGSLPEQGQTELGVFPTVAGGAAKPAAPAERAEPDTKAQPPPPPEAVAAGSPTPASGSGGRALKYLFVALVGAAGGGAAAYLLKPPPIPDTTFVNFDAESAPKGVLGDGWSPVFEKFQDGVTFSWCSALQCTLNVESHAKHERLIRARLLPFRFEGAPTQTVTVSLNGTKIGVQPVPDGLTTLSFPASREYWVPGKNTIAFEFAYARDPKSVLAGSGDKRALSAAFDWVDITTK
jgi:hypothetical protein